MVKEYRQLPSGVMAGKMALKMAGAAASSKFKEATSSSGRSQGYSGQQDYDEEATGGASCCPCFAQVAVGPESWCAGCWGIVDH